VCKRLQKPPQRVLVDGEKIQIQGTDAAVLNLRPCLKPIDHHAQITLEKQADRTEERGLTEPRLCIRDLLLDILQSKESFSHNFT
jgi:hypothetical protein